MINLPNNSFELLKFDLLIISHIFLTQPKLFNINIHFFNIQSMDWKEKNLSKMQFSNFLLLVRNIADNFNVINFLTKKLAKIVLIKASKNVTSFRKWKFCVSCFNQMILNLCKMRNLVLHLIFFSDGMNLLRRKLIFISHK